MKTPAKILTGLLLIATAIAASQSPALPSDYKDAPQSVNGSFGPDRIIVNGIFKFADNVVLAPKVEFFGGVRTVDPERPTLSFTKNEPVAVEILADGDVKIDLLVSEGEEGKIPESIIVSAAEFNKSGLKYSEQGGPEELFARYSTDEEYKEARRGGGYRRGGRMHIRNAAGGSYGGCVAYVCNAIGGCTGTVGNGVGMTNYLRNRGWRGYCNPSSPNRGDVASWSGGRGGRGHTGIWNGSGWCYDLGCGNPGSGYHFRNCVSR